MQNDRELVIVEMVEKNYYHVVEVLISLGAKTTVTNKKKESLLQIAFRKKYSETLKVLLAQLNDNNAEF